MDNIFLKSTDKDTTELYQRLRIGSILEVDETNAVVTIEWLDKKGARLQVPISMPFCENGWGIFAMPRKYGIVVCDVRTYEFPLILAYIPPNFMVPHSGWQDYLKIGCLPQDFTKGELIIRNLIDKARCAVCGKVYSLAEWALHYKFEDSMQRYVEHCPNPACPVIGGALAVEMTGEQITKVNKRQMGILLYLQTDGNLKIKINDGLDTPSDNPDNTDAFANGSLIEINFDDSSNYTVKGIQNFLQQSFNSTEKVKKVSHEQVGEKKYIESPLVITGNENDALTIGQAQKIISVLNRLIGEIRNHVHIGNLGSPTSTPGVAGSLFTTPQQSEIETTKTKAS